MSEHDSRPWKREPGTEEGQRNPEACVGFFRTSGARPPEMMDTFIDRHRAALGVEPICRVLQFAPSAYYERKRQSAEPESRSTRWRTDEALRTAIRRVWEDNFQVYGVRKVWRQLRREGFDLARCTIECLMREMDLQGVH
jgi:putative transposase